MKFFSVFPKKRKATKKNMHKGNTSCTASDLRTLLQQYNDNGSPFEYLKDVLMCMFICAIISAIAGGIIVWLLKIFFSPNYIWWAICSAGLFFFMLIKLWPKTKTQRQTHKNEWLNSLLNEFDVHLPSFIVLQGYNVKKSGEGWVNEYLVYFLKPLQKGEFRNQLRGSISTPVDVGGHITYKAKVTFNYDDNTAKIEVAYSDTSIHF